MSDLFDSVRIGRMQLPNRLFMAPMTRSRSRGGSPGDLTVEYYAQRASAGLIITEGVQPSVRGQGYTDTPGLHSAEQVEAWKRVTGAVHERGGRIFAQIMHAGRIGHPVLYPDGGLPVGPSAVRSGASLFDGEKMLPHPVPREMTASDIAEALDDFASAARNAVTAGFDGVEVHGANGYLIQQFLADGSNRRTDDYGGSAENRARFAVEAVDAVADTIGADRTGLRVSPGTAFNGISESDPLEQYLALLDGLRHRSSELAYLHLTESGSAEYTQRLRKEWAGAFVLNTASGTDLGPVTAALAEERADAVAVGAAWLANPDLPARIRAGGPFNAPDRATYYGGDHRGYTDYPALEG
ncbi:alkene reductase [Nocardiopsis sp. TSRI0078]|uniref:alkene reductase n=1 Tax=unclassified Nocardiopsis TaxID=2649073 RepID=UPI0009394E2D|nr:alkene reductase [Nocardiopsis sp. TSRI0078]OKI18849.1 alkene reductase [Nocardiopsis sp. TSRI0078]